MASAILETVYEPYILIKNVPTFTDMKPFESQRYKCAQVVYIPPFTNKVDINTFILYDSEGEIVFTTSDASYSLINWDKIRATPNLPAP